MIDGEVTIQKKVVMAYLKVLCQNLPAEAEEGHKNFLASIQSN
jgi:hypothetical protein